MTRKSVRAQYRWDFFPEYYQCAVADAEPLAIEAWTVFTDMLHICPHMDSLLIILAL